MHRSGWWPTAAVLTIALLASVPASQAQTTFIDVRIGDSFEGTISQAGSDTVTARFFALAGAELRFTVQAVEGSTLQPTIVVRDGSGQTVPGSTQSIHWMPVGNLIHYVTIPATGSYSAVIGGSAGSGGFWAAIAGSGGGVQGATVSGTVTDSVSGAPVAGATVLANGSAFAVTGEDGTYAGALVAGSYTLTFAATGFASASVPVTVGSTAVVANVTLVPQARVTVTASVSGSPAFGGSVTATVDIEAGPGVTVDSIRWTQEFGTTVGIANGTTDTATVTLGSMADYKAHLIEVLSEPPIGEEDLPPNVPLPEGEFPGGLQDRLQVVALNPFALEEGGLVVLRVEVETSAGTFADEAEIHVSMPFKVSTGLRNVPIGVPVLLRAVEDSSYAWTMSPPPGSTTILADASTREPYFTPDVAGRYVVRVSDGAGGPVSTLEVFAGTWRGIIVDQDMNGRPVSDTACTFCHDGDLAPDEFTNWAQTGHAEIFTNSLNTNSHYSSNCFSCHTVGYDPGSTNGGVDEASDYQDFLDAGLLSNPGDNWTTVLDQFPETARLANIQCENCHGPQDSIAHGFAGPIGEPRASLSSDVCGSCHGEPLRHARFQQWQLSAHANYELAIDEGDDESCSRCHTANGFLTWLPILLGDEPGDPLDDITVTWELEDVHPQTCVTCHDPHDIGTSSGNDPDVNIRISGDTPPLIAGFTATDVGRGAICMTCHNSRRGLRNDGTFDAQSTSERARAPHGSVQADVLMGQNAYLVEVGTRGGHGETEDTCVACHMKATPPPELLSYNLGGANHTFYAERTICGNCHSPYLRASDVQDGVQALLDQVEDLFEDAIHDLMAELIADGNTIDLDGDRIIDDMDEVSEIQFSESRGRQALIVTFTDTSELGPYSMTNVDVRNAGNVVIGHLYDFADERIAKAGWNWILIHNDGSVGVHNPFFASGALIAARDALVELAGDSAVSVERKVLRDESTRPALERGGTPGFQRRR